MDHNEFVEHYEAQGMTVQAEEMEQNQWMLQAVDRHGAIVGTLPITREAVQELYASGRLTRQWDTE